MKVEQYLKTVRKMSSRVIISLKHRPEGLQLNGEHIRTIDRIHAGDTLSVTMEDTPPDYLESEIRVPVLYEDEDVMVYNKPVDMPVAWTKYWGNGRVFYTSLGHHDDVFDKSPNAQILMERGMVWAGEGKAYAVEHGLTTERFENTAKMY